MRYNRKWTCKQKKKKEAQIQLYPIHGGDGAGDVDEGYFVFSIAIYLTNQFDNTSSGFYLLLGKLGYVAGLDDNWNFRESSLSKDLRVAEGQKVDDWGDITGLLGEVLLAGVGGDERPELIEVDNGVPEVVLLLVEVPHTDLTEVTGMVPVEVGPVVVLTTSHTTTTRMLPVLAHTSVTG